MAKRIDPLLQTRASLLIRLKNLDDQTSWQTFFDTYRSLIYGVAIRAGLSHAEAEDVLQETIISVAKHIAGFRYDPAKGSFKAWLLVNTRRRIIGYYRKRIPRRDARRPSIDRSTVAELDNLVHPDSKEFEDHWEREWQQTLLEAATFKVKRELDPKHYQIFDFCVNRGWPAEQTAARFGVSVGNIYMIKHRVTCLLKAEIGRLEKQII